MSGEETRPEGQDPVNSPRKRKPMSDEQKQAISRALKEKKRKPEKVVQTADYDLLVKGIAALQTAVAALIEERAAEKVGAKAAAAEENVSGMPELAAIQKLPVEQREEALRNLFQNMTPEKRAQLEGSIRAAYATVVAPVADDERKPGSYVVTGRDHLGSDIKSKVRFRREDILAMYPTVTLFPMVPMRGGVTVQGINFPIEAGKPQQVPSIVAELYNNYIETVKRENERWGPLLPEEKHRLEYLIAKGEKRVWTRVHQVGVGVMPAEAFPNADAEAPGTEA